MHFRPANAFAPVLPTLVEEPPPARVDLPRPGFFRPLARDEPVRCLEVGPARRMPCGQGREPSAQEALARMRMRVPPPGLPPAKPPRSRGPMVRPCDARRSPGPLSPLELQTLRQACDGDASELAGRLARHGGLKGWWRKHFGPKPVPGRDVMGLARTIAQRLAPALDRYAGDERVLAERQVADMLAARFADIYRLHLPSSRKHWAARVAGGGTGEFRVTWRELVRQGATRRDLAAHELRGLREPRLAMQVIHALQTAPLRF